MGTGLTGTFVISWSQTEVDGLQAAPVDSLSVGVAWAWKGEAVRVDSPSGVLRLDQADGEAALRRRAAKTVRRLVGAALSGTTDLNKVEIDNPLNDRSFVVTDGTRSYTVTLIEVAPGSNPLLMFLDDLPPRDRELWVVHHSLDVMTGQAADPSEGGVICFATGTRITTPDGPKLIEQLREGDKVMTRDNGAQEVLWIGARKMTGARLFAMPRMRPIRIRAGALGIGRPDEELLVSPEHRMLVKGAVSQALFNTPEVLVEAKDLINGDTIVSDVLVKEVTYVHLMLPSHQIIWANNVETESFHPANTAMSTLSDWDRDRLLWGMPDLQFNPHGYGAYARRNLNASEAAILKHEAA